ncbi:hypothetical protein BDV23DRAFT_177457 [Aspergillus alliaceus]|uniref:Uncharacterized protein n=1 Tax=Petromyces alliaceus TaxID=209559 RepID=A0A5N7CRB8_PETAA|nr:hypothetical protein BDV23DRAFT_177457 [Aspergillus alliaceus]
MCMPIRISINTEGFAAQDAKRPTNTNVQYWEKAREKRKMLQSESSRTLSLRGGSAFTLISELTRFSYSMGGGVFQKNHVRHPSRSMMKQKIDWTEALLSIIILALSCRTGVSSKQALFPFTAGSRAALHLSRVKPSASVVDCAVQEKTVKILRYSYQEVQGLSPTEPSIQYLPGVILSIIVNLASSLLRLAQVHVYLLTVIFCIISAAAP